MMPMLTSVWSLAALAAIPALVAIYLFQRRFRSREVSSLLLWDAIRQASMGGRTREPLRLPLPFWLELIAIVLIALAAAGPLLPRWSRARPLVIVLDDSLSMSAGGSDAPRERALDAIRDAASGGAHNPVHVVFAGGTPQLAGGATLDERLRGWSCRAPAADLAAAIGFATQLGRPGALLLVITDHAPEANIEKGSVVWRAFGSPRANVAFAAAARSSGAHDRVLLEIASHATTRQTRTLTLGNGQTLPIALNAGERKRLQFEAHDAAPFEARLSPDEATFDDRVVLLPEHRPPVRVALRFANEDLREDVERAIRATGLATVTEVRPQLVVSDVERAGSPRSGGLEGRAPNRDVDGGDSNRDLESGDSNGALTWSIIIDASKAKGAVTGPYVLDRTHPLLRGLSFEGLIWGVPAPASNAAQDALVLVGNQVLLSDERVSGGHRIRMHLDPATSNVQRAPLWPAFWWNALAWRGENAPGVRAANITLGTDARVKLDGTRATITAPDGTHRNAEAIDGELLIATTQSGLWSVVTQTQPPTANRQPPTHFAVNPIVPAESDLTHAAAGTWGGWSEETLLSSGYQEAAWILLLLALAVLVWHHWSLWNAAPQSATARRGAA